MNSGIVVAFPCVTRRCLKAIFGKRNSEAPRVFLTHDRQDSRIPADLRLPQIPERRTTCPPSQIERPIPKKANIEVTPRGLVPASPSEVGQGRSMILLLPVKRRGRAPLKREAGRLCGHRSTPIPVQLHLPSELPVLRCLLPSCATPLQANRW